MRRLVLLICLCCIVNSSTAQVLSEFTTDETIWPNKVSYTNSDEWIRLHHDEIKVLRPRVLVLNFVNGIKEDDARQRVERVIRIAKEASRYHGFNKPEAPACLEYQIYKIVNLTDPEELPEESRFEGNSSKYPRIPGAMGGQQNLKFETLFSDEYAENYGVQDPSKPGKLLTLGEMISRGIINEVWFLAQGTLPELAADALPHWEIAQK